MHQQKKTSTILIISSAGFKMVKIEYKIETNIMIYLFAKKPGQFFIEY